MKAETTRKLVNIICGAYVAIGWAGILFVTHEQDWAPLAQFLITWPAWLLWGFVCLVLRNKVLKKGGWGKVKK